ncbi:hypothetical protein CEXT_747111 [Caerostris extrusa]|uniref:Uncharacterized protein n=1 Tax=Caerostris extrusa TaxID=172846 RepID=A0AAV4Y9X1_CAEEX|nr:hypothetical protein CEXT_747111 [Caerostris extrusa]
MTPNVEKDVWVDYFFLMENVQNKNVHETPPGILSNGYTRRITIDDSYIVNIYIIVGFFLVKNICEPLQMTPNVEKDVWVDYFFLMENVQNKMSMRLLLEFCQMAIQGG